MTKSYNFKDIIQSNKFPFHIEIARLDKDFDMHVHDFSELVVILKGTAQHIIDTEEYSIKAGDVYILNGETAHGFRQVKELEICNIMYQGEKLMEDGKNLKRLPGFQALFVLEPFYRREHHFRSRLQLGLSQQKSMEQMIHNMKEEYDAKREGYEIIVQSFFMILVTFLSRSYKNNDEKTTGELLRLAEVIAYMEQNYLKTVKLEELADRAGLSVRQFNRVFKYNYHTTPINYLIHLRLQHACSLMDVNEMNITQIAYGSGFSDSNYFARQFRRFYGMSPREYREKERQ